MAQAGRRWSGSLLRMQNRDRPGVPRAWVSASRDRAHLGVHYATVSRKLKKIERQTSQCRIARPLSGSATATRFHNALDRRGKLNPERTRHERIIRTSRLTIQLRI
jgi:hypothetical protein